ncbi:MAG: EF-hand domain-containing protein [Hyphomonadaceae bacterium]
MPTDETNKKPTKAKKSETLEVRIPYETKQAFLTACREDGTTASEVVRESVQTYLDGRERPPIPEKRTLIMKIPQPVRHYAPRIAAGSIAAIGLATFAALPSAAAPDFQAQFSRLDTNKDGVLSPDEFLGPKFETKPDNNVVIETRTVTHSGKDAPRMQIKPDGMKSEAFTFWLPDELGGGKDGEKDEQHEYKFISHREVKELKDGEQAPEAKTFTFSVDDMKKQEFDSIDANKDGKVTLDEYKARQTAMLTRGFEILDKNGDKSLTEAEYAKIVTPVVIKLNADDPDTPEPPQVDIPGMKKATPEQIKAAFTRLDANKDGKLSLKEYLPPS